VLGVIGVKKVLDAASTGSKGGKDEGTVRDGLGSGRSDLQRLGGVALGVDNNGGREDDTDSIVSNNRGLLLVGASDSGQKNNLLLASVVLLVNTHDGDHAVNITVLSSSKLLDTLVLERDRESVAGKTLGETCNGTRLEDAQMSGKLGLANHTDGDTLSVKHLGEEDSLHGVSDGVTEVKEVAESTLALVGGDNVGLDTDGSKDNALEDILDGVDVLVGGLDGVKDNACALLESGELGLVPDSGGLFTRSALVTTGHTRQGDSP
jgi:hypothetical protein